LTTPRKGRQAANRLVWIDIQPLWDGHGSMRGRLHLDRSERRQPRRAVNPATGFGGRGRAFTGQMPDLCHLWWQKIS
jgi:hypothetical protein